MMHREEPPMTAKRKPLKKGYFQIYTGNGKGKTTAALGTAFRAMGHGLRTYIGQFMKGQAYGELKACKRLAPFVTIQQYGKRNLMHVREVPEEDDIRMAKGGLKKARDAMLSGRYDIVVLDEITTAHFFHLISIEEMLDIVTVKPASVEVIFTGRYAPPELIQRADLVTEMKEVKHYYQQGVEARRGIER
jgi:cob(I)alamin adenosyltransferase